MGGLLVKGIQTIEGFRRYVDYCNQRVDATDRNRITADDVYVVWSCKTLQNWKAPLSTDMPDACTTS